MNPDWVRFAQGIAAVITVLMAISLVPIAKLIGKIRSNDLHHLDLKIDENHKALSQKVDAYQTVMTGQLEKVQAVMEVKIGEVQKSVDTVQEKLDDHISWHLNRGNN